MLEQRKDETVFEYWISFWPVAPFFGVRWRFEGMVPGVEAFRPADPAPASTPAPAARAPKQPAADPAPAPVEAAPVETAAVETVAAPEAETEAEPEPGARPAGLYDAAPAEADDLTRIKGVGPKLQALLNDLGVYRFDQIAGFSEADLAWVDAHLATFKGRPFRDGWIEQARTLMDGR
jgi:predicted flap endonuclease-1-like 5' DNA nuclease